MIFLSERRLAELKRRVKVSGSPEARLYRRVRATGAHWLRRPPVFPPPHASTLDDRRPAELLRSRTAQNCFLHMAFLFRMTGDARYLERCWRELECWFFKWKSWCDPFHGDARFFDLMTGEMGLSLGVAYDWIKEGLGPARRALFRSQIREKILDCYLRNVSEEAPAWWRFALHNWNPVCHGGAAVAALALRGEHPRWRKVVDNARRCMHPYFAKMARQGGSEEGTGYWQYGMRYGLYALEAMRGCGLDAGPWLRSKAMLQASRFPVDFCPGLKPVSWGDAAGDVRTSVMYLLAGSLKDAGLLAYADHACVDYPRARHPQGIENWDDLPLGLIWRPRLAGRAAAAPKGGAYPRIGWSCYYDQWKKPSWVGGFKCGDLGANHTQLDNLSFQIFLKGEPMAEDLGTGTYNRAYFSEARWGMYVVATAGHNAPLINGRGQRPGTLGTLRPLPSGAVGEAGACYGPGVLRATRHFLALGGGSFLLLDDILLKARGRVEWRLHSFRRASARGAHAVLKGRKASLHAAAPGGSAFRVLRHWVPITRSGASSVTHQPLRRREAVLSLRASGARRFVLPVLLSAGRRELGMAWKGKRLELELGGKRLAFVDGRHGLRLA